MPKRRRGERDGGSTADAERRQQQRLYLVFDDWDCGYSIRKVKLPLPSKSGDRGNSERVEKRLPNPFWRYPADRQCPQYFTSAFGTKIMGMHHNDSGIVQMIDVRTRSVHLGGPQTNCPAFPIYFPVGGDKLFALDSACLELCRLPLVRRDSGSDSDSSSTDETDSESDSDSYGKWSNGKWSWRPLPVPLFFRRDVTSYAKHGQNILVSVKGEETVATFTFDMGKFVWECLGEWTLPFTGRGHFDRKLKALVGISKDPEAFGYIYACNVPSAGDIPCTAPAWKCSKEKVFSEHPADRHVSASLIYMENRCEYCLVECVWVDEDNAHQVKIKGDKADQVLLEKPEEGVGGVPQRGECGRHMYRLMTFSLKYDKKDDLRVKCGRVCYYEVPNTVSAESIRQDHVAFWL
ncbi:unnamed protein product [Urochloa decumbens]|uniref:Uncharacterized protein n=1 Tax=Urochloa decumbens TaxID=240449 RepID=A0ABC9DMD8_9POAL